MLQHLDGLLAARLGPSASDRLTGDPNAPPTAVGVRDDDLPAAVDLLREVCPQGRESGLTRLRANVRLGALRRPGHTGPSTVVERTEQAGRQVSGLARSEQPPTPTRGGRDARGSAPRGGARRWARTGGHRCGTPPTHGRAQPAPLRGERASPHGAAHVAATVGAHEQGRLPGCDPRSEACTRARLPRASAPQSSPSRSPTSSTSAVSNHASSGFAPAWATSTRRGPSCAGCPPGRRTSMKRPPARLVRASSSAAELAVEV